MIEDDPKVRQVIDARNKYRGHGYCNQSDREFEGVFNTYWPVVSDLERQLTPLMAAYQFVCVQRSRLLRDRSVEYQVRLLHGDHPDFLVKKIKADNQTATAWDEGVFAIDRENGPWLELDPLVKYTECSACHRPRLILWDGGRFLDPYCGRWADAQ